MVLGTIVAQQGNGREYPRYFLLNTAAVMRHRKLYSTDVPTGDDCSRRSKVSAEQHSRTGLISPYRIPSPRQLKASEGDKSWAGVYHLGVHTICMYRQHCSNGRTSQQDCGRNGPSSTDLADSMRPASVFDAVGSRTLTT